VEKAVASVQGDIVPGRDQRALLLVGDPELQGVSRALQRQGEGRTIFEYHRIASVKKITSRRYCKAFEDGQFVMRV